MFCYTDKLQCYNKENHDILCTLTHGKLEMFWFSQSNIKLLQKWSNIICALIFLGNSKLEGDSISSSYLQTHSLNDFRNSLDASTGFPIGWSPSCCTGRCELIIKWTTQQVITIKMTHGILRGHCKGMFIKCTEWSLE